MEPITGNNLRIIENCIAFARQFLLLPDTIDVVFDACPSARFPTKYNAAESNINEIYFNKPWFLERTAEHRDDIEFFIFHELRHIHQLYSIFRYDHKLSYHDAAATIEAWRQGFCNYIRNTDDLTANVNVVQEIEVDANAYAQCLVNLLHLHDNIELHFSLPQAAAELSFSRSKQYYSKPELQRYLYNQQQNTVQNGAAVLHPNIPIRRGRKVGANDKCPCGSGQKFKRCCRGKGVYD